MAVAEQSIGEARSPQPRSDRKVEPVRGPSQSGPCRIAVLGDSTSSGIGLGAACYPAKLLRKLQDNLTVHIVNHAVPAITSADASRYFLSELSNSAPDYLVLYLGCTEGASSPHKGRYRPLRTSLRELFQGKKERRFKPILSPSPFRFRYQLRPATTATSPDEFRDNLERMIRGAVRQGTKVLLLNPVSNRRFPCGVGAANSSYFCFLDGLEKFGAAIENEPVDEATTALAAGVSDFAAGHLDKAVSAWRPLASEEGIVGFIARHNIACANALGGEEDAARELGALLGQSETYESIVLYNLAHLNRMRGDAAAYDEYHEQALESDISLYRMREGYRDAVASFASRQGVEVVDLDTILALSDFIDYCHPSEAGHEKIASRLADIIRRQRPSALLPTPSAYDIRLPSPNYLSSPGQTLVDYFCMDWPLDSAQIAAALQDRISGSEPNNQSADELTACVENFFKANDNHPIFDPSMAGASPFMMPRSNEVLSFPEFYICRLMHNYMKEFEAKALAHRVSAGAGLDQVRIPAAGYRAMILQSGQNNPEGEVDFSLGYLDHILSRICRQAAQSERMFRASIGARLRTVLAWYTRESFRYGTHSRPSMLYYRWDIDRIVEGTLVAMVIANRNGAADLFARLDRLLSGLLDLVLVHERYAQAYHQDPHSVDMVGYQAQLQDVKIVFQDQVSALGSFKPHSRHQIG